MTTTPDPREHTLPRWAQNELRAARGRGDRAEQALADRTAGTGKTRVWYGDYDNRTYLPLNTVVHWGFGDGSVRDEISVHLYRGGLTVAGGGRVSITPSATNCFDVHLAGLSAES